VNGAEDIDGLELRLRGTRHAVPLAVATPGVTAASRGDGWHLAAAAELVEAGNTRDPAAPARFSFFFHGDEALTLRSSIGESNLPSGATYGLRLYDLAGRFLGQHDFPLRGRTAVLAAPGVPGRGCIVLSLPGPAILAPLRIAIDSAGPPAADRQAALDRLRPALPAAMAALLGGEDPERPHPWFMPNWYRRFGQERLRRAGSAVEDYARRGPVEPLPVHPLFDTEWYVAAYAPPPGVTPLAHFAVHRDHAPNPAWALADRLGTTGRRTAPDALPDDPDLWLAPGDLPGSPTEAVDMSVVVPLAGRLAAAEPTITALLASGDPAASEILLVEHGVAPVDLPRLWEWARLFARLRILRCPEAGVSAAINHGVAAAQGTTLALVAPGTIVDQERLAALRSILARDAAAVQPVIVQPDHRLRSAGRSWQPAASEIDGPTGECLVLRRADFCAAGGLDPAMSPPAAFADLGARLRAATGKPLRLAGAIAVPCHEDRADPVPAGLPPRRTAPRPAAAGAALRIAIKVAHARGPIENSGDFHFATALAQALRAAGHAARIDRSADWYRRAEPADVALVLRGRSAYRPRADQINLAWLISHPDEAEAAELAAYDHVFAASPRLAARLAEQGLPASLLLQCTDPGLFHPAGTAPAAPRLIFVGNSRQVFRAMPAAAVAEALPLELYGRSWEKFAARQFLRGISVANADLPALYRAGIVFNDHWGEMAEAGILSNRLFDAAACASPIISDPVEGIAGIFGDLVATVMPGEPLAPVVARLVGEGKAERRRRLDLAGRIAAEHSFAARARTIVATVRQRLAEGLSPLPS